MDLMRRTPDKAFDLAIVDPPYGIGEDGRNKHHRTHLKNGKRRLSGDRYGAGKHIVNSIDYHISEWDNTQPDQSYFDELFRVSKRQIIWGANYIQFSQKSSSSGTVFWDKQTGSNDFSDGELAWVSFFKGVRKFSYLWNGMLQQNMKDKESRIHPTQKPVQLYKWLLKNYAKPGDKILDTHGGSLSIGIACHYMGFDLTACELDPDYYAGAVKRFKEQTAQLKAELF